MINYLNCIDLSSRGVNGKEILCERFSIARGDIVGIIGNSGAGCSLLLKLLAGALPVLSGELDILGTYFSKASYRQIQKIKARTGFIFEEGGLISNLNLYENIALPMRYHFKKLGKQYLETRIDKIIKLFGISEYAYLRPAQVSMETRKLCQLCRAYVVHPAIVFYDEPFFGLGLQARNFLKQYMIDLHLSGGVPALMAISDFHMIFNFANKFIIMDKGKIYKIINNNSELKALSKSDPVIWSLVSEVDYAFGA